MIVIIVMIYMYLTFVIFYTGYLLVHLSDYLFIVNIVIWFDLRHLNNFIYF